MVESDIKDEILSGVINVKKLKKAAEDKKEREVRYFENRLAINGKKISDYAEDLKKLIKRTPHVSNRILEIINLLDVYEAKIIADVANPFFGQKGRIPEILREKEIDWEKLNQIVQEVTENLTPMIPLVDELIEEIEKLEKYSKYKESLRKQEWFAGLSDDEKEQRTKYLTFYHAYDITSNKSSSFKQGQLDVRDLPDGLFLAQDPKIAMEIVSEWVEPARMGVAKIMIIQKLASRLISRVMGGMGVYFRIPVDKFDEANKEIKKRRIIIKV